VGQVIEGLLPFGVLKLQAFDIRTVLFHCIFDFVIEGLLPFGVLKLDLDYFHGHRDRGVIEGLLPFGVLKLLTMFTHCELLWAL